jgi:pyrroline-5-carboxylate reductase
MGELSKDTKITFIGCGAMGEAILKGILKGGLVTKDQITAGVPSEGRKTYLTENYAIAVTHDNAEAVKGAHFVVLAVKPQMAKKAVTPDMCAALEKDACIVSIMGSYSIDMLKALVPGHPIVRVMPNTPLSVGMGMSALTATEDVSEKDKKAVEAIFTSCGEAVWVDESAMEAITAISGCGPGYMFVIIDALADAGVMAGLPRKLAIQLAAQTMAGSGVMALKTGLHPAQLRDQVTSPGGTTIAGIKALENHAVRGAFYDAVQAVLDRSAALKK